MSFSANLAAVDAAVASYFDEDLITAHALAKPLRDTMGAPQIDVSRPSFQFFGTLDLEPSINALGASEAPSARSPADRHVARICLSALAIGWPWMPKPGDHLECRGVRHAISAPVDRDGTNRVVFWLNRIPA